MLYSRNLTQHCSVTTRQQKLKKKERTRSLSLIATLGMMGRVGKWLGFVPLHWMMTSDQGDKLTLPKLDASRRAWTPRFMKEQAGKPGRRQHFLPQPGHHFCHLQKYTLLYLGSASNRALSLSFSPSRMFLGLLLLFHIFPYHLGKSSSTHIPESIFPAAS